MTVPAFALADVTGKVTVIDGDTFDVGGTRVRLFGIDAPEADQTCTTEQGQKWQCGAWVGQIVHERYSGTRAVCKEVDRDLYGRVVATCDIGGTDVGETLVSEGLAFAYRRYSMAYDLIEKSAAIRDVGLHASRVQDPSQFHKTRARGRIPPDRSCPIKGNISSKGTRIFHMPGQRDYERTGIRTDRGERWFCSEDEAVRAGWRAARR
ncbi:thermonuclease family protein [uncultured Roseobacter sp.]|uniref:thermonuclease family protein n=1 Tax=uncultured Roseobacter sp. TaxID=114847 RepID=UPI00260D9845|nr:thermonuclease family protein [uncultured Roseobacter sp.]